MRLEAGGINRQTAGLAALAASAANIRLNTPRRLQQIKQL